MALRISSTKNSKRTGDETIDGVILTGKRMAHNQFLHSSYAKSFKAL